MVRIGLIVGIVTSCLAPSAQALCRCYPPVIRCSPRLASYVVYPVTIVPHPVYLRTVALGDIVPVPLGSVVPLVEACPPLAGPAPHPVAPANVPTPGNVAPASPPAAPQSLPPAATQPTPSVDRGGTSNRDVPSVMPGDSEPKRSRTDRPSDAVKPTGELAIPQPAVPTPDPPAKSGEPGRLPTPMPATPAPKNELPPLPKFELPPQPAPTPKSEVNPPTVPKLELPPIPPTEPKKLDSPAPAKPEGLTLPPLNLDSPKKESAKPKNERPDWVLPVIPVSVSESKFRPSAAPVTDELLVKLVPIEGQRSGSMGRLAIFNYTARPVTLTLDTTAYTIPAQASVILEVADASEWQLAGRREKLERAADSSGWQMIIRPAN